MPPLEDLEETEPALLWEFRRFDGAGEAVVADAPEELDVRWVTTTRWVPGPDGQTLQIDAKVCPPRAVPPGSLLFRGSLSDYQDALLDGTAELYKTATRSEAKDLKGRHARYEYGCTFYRGSLPGTTGP